MAFREAVSVERLKEVLHYSPESGIFTWRVKMNRCIVVGSLAGTLVCGYNLISIDRVTYRAHRLAWLYMTGGWPTGEIDHRNRNRQDNRFCNLRVCTRKQNMENVSIRSDNKSGFRGVGWVEPWGKWRVRIVSFQKEKHIGLFDNLIDAVAARLAVERSVFTHRHD